MGSIWNAVKADVRRTYEYQTGGTVANAINTLRAPGVQAVVVYRYGQWVKTLPLVFRILFDPIYLVLNGLIKLCWGIELPRAAKIGGGLYIGHFGGITISAATVMGSNCNISQGITIGVSGAGEKRGVPVIGNNVYIAPGARVFGKIRIGNNVKIGANAVVHGDVPDNSLAILSPGFVVITRDQPLLNTECETN